MELECASPCWLHQALTPAVTLWFTGAAPAHLSVWAPIMWKPFPGSYLLPTAKATMVDRFRVK